MLDTAIFFSLAFAAGFAFLDTSFGLPDGSLPFPVTLAGFEMPLWLSLAIGDFSVKMLIDLLMLIPYGALLSVLMPLETSRRPLN